MFRKLLLALGLMLGVSSAQAACTVGALPFNLQNNTVADATQVMANFNQIGTGTAANCAGNGANTDITSLGGLTTPLSAGQGGTVIWTGGTSTGSANAQVVASVTPATGFSLTQNKCVLFTAGFTNTASPTTLNVFSTGATQVYRQSPSGAQTLTGGELVATDQALACYDGTRYQLMNPPYGDFTVQTSIASGTQGCGANCTDLGTIASHNALISGTTTINSFGTTPSVTYPFYIVTFSGALQLTYNATSMILPGTANITTAANDTALLQYLGSGNWQVMAYNKANGTAVVNPTPLCATNTLVITNNAGTPNTSIDVSWKSVNILNGSVPIFFGAAQSPQTLDLTAGTVTSAANGMDGETRGNTRWIDIFLISDGTNVRTLGSRADGNGLTPTLPAGFTYNCYFGAMRLNAAGNLLTSTQKGSRGRLVVNPTVATVPFLTPMASANVGQVWTAIATGAFVPPTATEIEVLIYGNTANDFIAVAPNPTYPTTIASPAVGDPCLIGEPAGPGQYSIKCDVTLESTNIYYMNNTTNHGVFMYGWKDSVNAN